ncbi:MAG TPA: AarF/ABC1/UbiB kinase family protein, partial [Myxococcota bacterium]|nr:AarF/ABC1/UbiB kinase family protein [Myxococcota bacterium]
MKRRLIPTPLLVTGDRPPMVVVPLQPPRRLRALQVLIVAASLLWIALGLRLRGQLDDAAWGRLIRQACERLGGLWIKAGQLLGMRRDLYSAELCDELSLLHDRAAGFPFEVIRQILTEELGDPDRYFMEISEVPVAAASIGQVHAAWLRDGRKKVAIKVQRPGIQQDFARDMRILGWLSRALHRLRPHQNWDEMSNELHRIFDEEVDYRIEATRVRLMRRNLKRHKVVAPRVYAHLCGPRVLVSEFIDGVFISEYIAIKLKDPERARRWEADNGVDPRKVARRILCSHLRQLLEDNLFHADLHPGNMLLLRDSRFALIDFGSVGELEASFRARFEFMNRAVGEGNYAKFADIYLSLAPYLPPVDYDAVKAEMVRVLRDWSIVARTRGLPYHQRSLTRVTVQLSRVLIGFQIPVPWDLLRINRARLTMDAGLAYLDPDLEYLDVVARYRRQARQRKIAEARSPERRRERLSLLATLPANLGEELAESLYLRADDMRRRSRHFRAAASKVATLVGAALQAAGVA